MCFCLTNGFLEIYYKSLTEIYKELPEDMFLRCSKDAIVNRRFVEYVDIQEDKIYLSNTYGRLSVGRTYKRTVIEELMHD